MNSKKKMCRNSDNILQLTDVNGLTIFKFREKIINGLYFGVLTLATFIAQLEDVLLKARNWRWLNQTLEKQNNLLLAKQMQSVSDPGQKHQARFAPSRDQNHRQALSYCHVNIKFTFPHENLDSLFEKIDNNPYFLFFFFSRNLWGFIFVVKTSLVSFFFFLRHLRRKFAFFLCVQKRRCR